VNSNDYSGIWLSSSSNNEITNNNALDNRYGIYMHGSSNNMLENNTANPCRQVGLANPQIV